jgi:hypothetical protein
MLSVVIVTIVVGVSFWVGLAVVVGAGVLLFAVIYRVRNPRTLLLFGLIMALAAGFGVLQGVVYSRLGIWALLVLGLGVLGLEVRRRRRA